MYICRRRIKAGRQRKKGQGEGGTGRRVRRDRKKDKEGQGEGGTWRKIRRDME